MTASKNGKKQQRNKSKKQNQSSSRSRLFVSPFPPIKVARTRYAEQYALQEAAAGVGAYYVLCPSSLYDPNSSGAGHQPMYFDQLCTAAGPYLKYRAMDTVARFSLINTSTTPMMAGWYVAAFASAPPTLAAMVERPWSNFTQLSPKGDGATKKEWTVRIPHAKAMGISKQHLMNDEYFAGSYNGAPTNNCFLVIWIWTQLGTVGSATMAFEMDTTSQFYSLANETSS